MKQLIQFTRVLWDSGDGTNKAREFVMEIDTDRIPVGPLHKARSNKRGSAKALSGAVTIRPKAEKK